MKKITFVLLFSVAATVAQAQTNFQLHYDLGQGRNYFTSTLEMFKPDNWGDTFFFVDIDFDGGKSHYPSMAYMEIARCLKFWKAPLSLHVEYNGGLMGLGTNYIPINNAYLAGVDYAWHDNSFTKFLNFKLLYKHIQEKNPLSFQLTAVWNLNFFNNKLTLSGFADFWRENNTNFTDARGNNLAVPTDTKFVFVGEPQFWYNPTTHLSLGSEIEVASNFGTVKGLKICPTLAVKWNF
jgi:hypothetical protein